ncbi:hypothetical protein [Nocardioides cavernaquae]|nr:hypothetical protein [Nocardioides cavernaquae]
MFMLGARTSDIANDLLAFSEAAAAEWMIGCTDDELVRVCSVADWLLLHGPTTKSGASMQLAKACALAAVYVMEGAPRELASGRRARVPDGAQISDGRWPNYALQEAAPRHYGVGADAIAYWA